ncbi:uncharacterized protein LOC124307179 isoform X1 [Neodiprion virginianus]|uniref:uncharacterized protein LOC124307179 isoform X1 n=1 Tax=Neodiprion virginianus TaxID=2961670 RepID=UPI001EE77542|nr:uncharacterized protein LOC124307179 isoform X1 [Neodiprion virginianus]
MLRKPDCATGPNGKENGAAGLAPSMKRISLLYSGGCIIRQIFEAKNEIRRVEMADKTENVISAEVSTAECYRPRGRLRFPTTRWLIVRAYCHSSASHRRLPAGLREGTFMSDVDEEGCGVKIYKI